MIRIIIMGMSGHMGRAIASLAMQPEQDFTVAAGVDKFPAANEWNIPVYNSIFEVEEPADAVIDFSRPEALPATLAYAKLKGLRAVIGTTGFSEDDKALIQQYAQSVPVFSSGSMSLGVNLQIELIKRAAATLGEGFDVEIVEKHHHFKVDAPSGTALMLADGVSTQYPTPRKYLFGRYTKTERRKPNEIGLHSIRGGTIAGEHEVMFLGQDEVLEVNHRAYSKQVFAAGALRAAAYLMQKEPGLYNMQDIVMEKQVLSHLYTVEDQAVVSVSGLPHVSGVLHSVFEPIAARSIVVDMISSILLGYDQEAVSFSLPAKQLDSALDALNGLKQRYPDLRVDAITGLTKLTVEGAGMEYRHGVAAELFDVMAANEINTVLVSTSETKIACCVENSQVHRAVDVILSKLDL